MAQVLSYISQSHVCQLRATYIEALQMLESRFLIQKACKSKSLQHLKTRGVENFSRSPHSSYPPQVAAPNIAKLIRRHEFNEYMTLFVQVSSVAALAICCRHGMLLH